MLPIRIKACSESDLRMLGNLARNIQRVLPVTQADIDAAAALGKGWVVWKVIEVNDPIDNLRGGTQLVIKQNSITPGQNVRRVLIVSGPGGETVVIGPGPSPLLLPDAIADSLTYVKAFGGTEQRNLPAEYTQLEYLGSDSQAYIDTGIAGGKDTLVVECRFMYNTFVAYGGVYGNYVSDSHNGIRCILANSENRIITNNNTICTTSGNTELNCDISQIHTVISKHDTVILDGVATSIQNTATGTENANNIALFNRSITNPNTSRDIGLRVYGFKIYDADVLVSDLIPCRRKSDSVLGMYDTVSGQFFTNAGTSTFTAGPEAVPTPDAPMDIVSNNGVIKYGKPITLDATRYYAYLAVGDTWSYSSDSYSIIVPVEVGKQYKITADPTTPIDGLANVILRWAFVDELPPDSWKVESSTAPTPSTIVAYDKVRTTPQETPSVIVTATRPYMIVQMGAGIFASNIANGRISVAEQSIYTDGTVETIKDSLNNIATAEMLLKVGDYQDVQSILDGVVTRNVGVRVLDGTEDWSQTDSYSNPWVFYTTFSDGKSGSGTLEKVYCTHFQGVAETNPNMPPESAKITVQGASPTISRFYVKTAAASTIELWKAYLAAQYTAGTPVIVLYPLATATTESVAGQTLQVTDGDNTLEITQASLSGLELEAEYEKVA